MRNPGSSSNDDHHRTKLTPCLVGKFGLKRGPWTPEEDELLSSYVKRVGEGRWRTLPKCAGLLRCGKSCRLRWMNYLRPSVKHGPIAPDEEDLILRLHRLLGNRWALIAGRIPGRTDNEIKNYWNTHLSKKLINQGIDPRTHKPLIINPNPNSNSTSSRKLIFHPHSTTPPIVNPNPKVPGLDQSATTSDHVHKIINNDDDVGIISNNDNNIGDGDDHGFSSFLNSLLNSDDEDINISNQQYPLIDNMMMMMMSNWETEFA